jgi:hypothetical protein
VPFSDPLGVYRIRREIEVGQLKLDASRTAAYLRSRGIKYEDHGDSYRLQVPSEWISTRGLSRFFGGKAIVFPDPDGHEAFKGYVVE